MVLQLNYQAPSVLIAASKLGYVELEHCCQEFICGSTSKSGHETQAMVVKTRFLVYCSGSDKDKNKILNVFTPKQVKQKVCVGRLEKNDDFFLHFVCFSKWKKEIKWPICKIIF